MQKQPFPVGRWGGEEGGEGGEGARRNVRTGGGYQFRGGVSTPLHAMFCMNHPYLLMAKITPDVIILP